MGVHFYLKQISILKKSSEGRMEKECESLEDFAFFLLKLGSWF